MKFLTMRNFFLLLLTGVKCQVSSDEEVIMGHGVVVERTDAYLRRDKR